MDKWFSNLVFYLLPHWKLYTTPWLRIWHESQQRSYMQVSRFTLLIISVTYILHHFFVDAPLGLTSDAKWIYYRFGVAAASLLCLALSFKFNPQTKAFIYKMPMALLGMVASYLQTQSMIWYNEVPYFWGIVIPIIFVLTLKVSPLASLAYCAIIYTLQFNHYLAIGLELPVIIGTCFTGLVFVAVLKRPMTFDVSNFIDHHKKMEIEKKLFESKKEFTEQIQGFLPKVINERILKNMGQNKMSVLQAIDEELHPREKVIACLHCDIRSFTHLSKNTEFIRESLITDTNQSVTIVEDYGGIPRTIGDLVFSYFDSQNIRLNALKAFLVAYEMRQANKVHNKKQDSSGLHLKRFNIMTIGPAIVGNIGGSGSAREITAIGSCVNKSARMDELTKKDQYKSIVNNDGVLMDSPSYLILSEFIDLSHFKEIHLISKDFKVRDFNDEKSLWFLAFSEELKHIVIQSLHKGLSTKEAPYQYRSAA